MADQQLKSNYPEYAENCPVNALIFTIESLIKKRVNTAIPVTVTGVESGGSGSNAGYVTVKPLVCQLDAGGETLEPVDLFKVPYYRLQGGKVAIVTDPIVGDIGLAIFAQADSSNVTAGTTKPVQPGSFRYFDMADGFYIGGFLNQAPTCYLELNQDNTVTLHATEGITIDGDTTINGNVRVNGTLTTDGTDGGGNATFGGTVTATGDVVGAGISLATHTHTCPDGTTSSPDT